MAIVLPSRRKKSDIFAPSKAIQDAKAKIGPAYFDITLLECSRNAVELTKLIARWEELEKEKRKLIKDLNREEEILTRLVRAHRPNQAGHKRNQKEGIETLDGKTIPPGFRYRANGDIKQSSFILPLVDLNTDLKDHEKISDSEIAHGDGKSAENITVSKSKLVAKKSDFGQISSYEEEIAQLELVIREIHRELTQYKIGVVRSQSTEKFHTYLRAHKNEHLGAHEFDYSFFSNSPNDRFAFKPGSNAKLHKMETKTPTFRSCTGCKFKLKCHAEDDKKPTVVQSEDLTKRRWNYVPQGKYVQSSVSLYPKSSSLTLTKKSSSTQSTHKTEKVRSILKHPTKSRVQFQNSQTKTISSGTISTDGLKSPYSFMETPTLVQSSMSPNTKSASAVSTDRGRGVSAMSANRGRSVSAMSANQGRSFSSVSRMSGTSLGRSATSNLLIDHESRFQKLKRMQEEEQRFCDYKVKAFLSKLDNFQPQDQ